MTYDNDLKFRRTVISFNQLDLYGFTTDTVGMYPDLEGTGIAAVARS